MKNWKWKKIIVLYFLILFLTLWLFLPIDILAYRDLVTKNIGKYFIINISIISVLIFISALAVLYFNNKFWSKKPIFRIILEIVFAFLLINLIQFIAQNMFATKVNIQGFISTIIRDKYFFTSCLEGGFVILMIETIYLYNKRKESELEREKFKYIQLKKQLNPHFLFNSLNILSAMGYTQTPKEIATYTSKLADVYRYILSNDEKNIIPLKEELKFIYQYVDILNARFSDNLILNINIDDNNKDKKILLMTLQLLIENAVKHNTVSEKSPLIINIYSEQGYVVVSNNINKREIPYASTGIGLKNLNERYNIIANKNIIIINKDNIFTVKSPLI